MGYLPAVLQCSYPSPQKSLPDTGSSWKASTLDLTSHKQDVVQIAIEPESSPAGLIPDNGNSPMHLDNSHTIEIEAEGLLILFLQSLFILRFQFNKKFQSIFIFCLQSLSFFTGRVDTSITWCAPHRSGRAAFPHPALYGINYSTAIHICSHIFSV
mgnify:CR=1 FL=1